MNNSIQVFNYNDYEIRTVQSERDGNVWFVAKDVCDVLGHTNSRVAVQQLDDDEKDVSEIYTLGGMQEMTIISESGLYTLILRSNKPNAKEFRRWVTGTVLPSVMRNGFYATPATAQKIIEDPDTFITVLQELKNQQAKNAELQAQAERDKPKVIFADAVDASKDSILIGNLAKILKQNGVDIGQNRLFAWFREHGYLMNISHGERKNMPTQKSMDMGLFEVKKTVVNNPDGSTRITHTTKVTGKGQVYFINLFLNERAI